MASGNSDLEDFSSDDEGELSPLLISSKKSVRNLDYHLLDSAREREGSDENIDAEEAGEEEDVERDNASELNSNFKLARESGQNIELDAENETITTKTITKDRKTINAAKKQSHKTGVVYFSSIPPYMKPAKMRQILSRFGDVDRLFLRREDEQKHKQRTRGGGNKKMMYEEGWAEFIRKRDAKLCAQTLNGNIIGGKKGSFYHDDILNVKYLPGFKWTDLTEQIARENDVRQSKLEKEIAMANKLNAEYTKNVEISKTISNMKKSNKRPQDSDNKIHREFKQHKVATARANAPQDIKQSSSSMELGSVLNNLL